jgi:signal transduction histidine kinase
VLITGPLTVVSGLLLEDLEAVVREAVSNVVRHSGARALSVTVAVGDEVVVDIGDDGIGVPADLARRSGLANLATRARDRGGDFTIRNRREGGAQLRWTVPFG